MSSLWSLDEFDRVEPDRAALLRSAPSWLGLRHSLCEALRTELKAGNVRFGFEESCRSMAELRAVVQFAIPPRVFDWLFNAHTGYRAQYRASAENGLAENAVLLSELLSTMRTAMPHTITAHRLSCEFAYIHPVSCTAAQLLSSLDPSLSKVWACERLINPDGRIDDIVVSRTGPQLTFNDTPAWSSLYAESHTAWLDVKGAFVSHGGLYQPKDSAIRARTLNERGSA